MVVMENKKVDNVMCLSMMGVSMVTKTREKV